MRCFPAGLLCAAVLLAQQAPVEKAWAQLAKGERREAVATLHELLNGHPDDADARLLLGSILTEDGAASEAIAQLTEAVRLRPQSAEARNALGEAYRTFANPTLALEAFAKAASLDPAFAEAQVNLGQSLVDAGEFASAAKPLDSALKRMGTVPDSAYPLYLRAKVDTEASDVQQAAARLEKAVTLRPDMAEAWSDLGQARKTLLDDTGALAAFEKAVAIQPDDAVAQYRLGSEYLHLGDTHSAVEHLKKAVALNAQDQSALYALQVAFRHDGQPDEARLAKEKLAELLRNRDKAAQDALLGVQLNNQGVEFQKQGNLRAALEKYEGALKLNPDHVGFRVNYAVALLRLGDWTRGIAELKEAARRDPTNTAVQAALKSALAQAPRGPSVPAGNIRPPG